MHTLVKVTGMVGGVVLDQLEYLTTNGTVLATYALTVTTYDISLYYTFAHICPDGMIVIRVSNLFTDPIRALGVTRTSANRLKPSHNIGQTTQLHYFLALLTLLLSNGDP